MRFIHDHRKAFARQFAHAVQDHPELLQGGHDDPFAVLQRPFEIFRGHAVIAGDVHQHSRRLDHLAQRPLELAINHPAVGDHDHRAEDWLAVGRVQGGEAVGQPGDAVGLAAARAVLVQITPPRPVLLGIGAELAHAGELVKAWENLPLLVGLLALVIEHVHHPDEALNQVEDARLLPDVPPQVARRVVGLAGRIARAAVRALIKGEKLRLGPSQFGGHINQIVVYGKVGQAALEAEQRLLGIAGVLVLLDRVTDVLARDLVLQFDGENRQAVEENAHVQRLPVRFREIDLPLHVQEVFLIKPTALLRHGVGGLEVAQVEMPAAVDVEAPPQGVQRAFLVHHFLDALEQVAGRLRFVADQLAVVRPLLRLGGADEGNDRLRPQAQRLVVIRLLGGQEAMRLQQDGFDVFFKRGFGSDLGHG